jgi:hypothetical protein
VVYLSNEYKPGVPRLCLKLRLSTDFRGNTKVFWAEFRGPRPAPHDSVIGVGQPAGNIAEKVTAGKGNTVVLHQILTRI